VAKEIVAAEPGTRQDLILDLRHTLVRVDAAESDSANGSPRWLLFRAPAVSGSRPAVRSGEAPELWFEWGERRIECQLRDAAGWQELDGAAVALYEAAVGSESRRSGKGGVDSGWGLHWGSDELTGELAPDTVELVVGARAGRG
jgi:hypothetical protein